MGAEPGLPGITRNRVGVTAVVTTILMTMAIVATVTLAPYAACEKKISHIPGKELYAPA